VTAFPLVHETAWLAALLEQHRVAPEVITVWVRQVANALHEQSLRAPFLAYGTDWLAFAHLVLAVAFLGPYRDPVRNLWTLQFGLFACAAVPFLAFIAGPVRGIPVGWRLIDCSFGLFGAIPLLMALRETNRLEDMMAARAERNASLAVRESV
jgi:hypothetical protein